MKKLFFLLIGLLCCAGPRIILAQNVEGKRIDRYFRNTYYTGTEYLWLRADGAYRRFNREHMGIFLHDKGTWEIKGDEIILTSAQRVKHVVHYPLQIYLYRFKGNDRELINFLVSSRAAVTNFLKKHSATEFASSDIEKISAARIKDFPDINVLSGVETVKREEVEGLVKAIDEFLGSSEKNIFRIKQVRYKAFTFLVWLDELQVFDNDEREIKKKIDELPAGHGLAMVLVETSKAVFDKESKSTQPFIYHTEMNERIPQPGGDEIE